MKQKHNENMIWLYQRIIKEFALKILHSNESIDTFPGRIVEIILNFIKFISCIIFSC